MGTSITDTILANASSSTSSQGNANLATPPDSNPGSGYASDVANGINNAAPNPYVPGPCNINSQAQPTLVGVSAVVLIPSPQFNVFDVKVSLPRPTRRLTIASFGTQNGQDIQDDTYQLIAISLAPTGLNGAVIGANLYTPNGTEIWIPLPGQVLAVQGTTIEFDAFVNYFYLHVMASTSNLFPTFSFICDGFKVTYQPQPTFNPS